MGQLKYFRDVFTLHQKTHLVSQKIQGSLAYIKLSPTYEMERVERSRDEPGVNTIFLDVIEIRVYAVLSFKAVFQSA